MYVAPTWKLARNKQDEYGCSVGTHATLLMCDPTNNPFANASVLVIDEVSMMTNEEKTQIINHYHAHKLIFCGDINHQIPYVTSFKPPKSTVFNTEGLDNVMEFNSDYRATCEKLKDLKQVIRDLIDMHIHTPPKELLRKFNSIAERDLIKRYTVNDMVLCCSNKRKDEFRDCLKGNKYYITKTTNKYSCGDIIITDTEIPAEFFPERRHAFTVHSIQGETCRTNLYISPEIMDMRMFYTAISRAQTYDQIFFIRD
jgi:ATP-dependent exoDNAse (exonuclease V) alpha subunit